MNSALAPWENPDLPAPVAVIERAIEGRARRFALWFWDGRLVWRDLAGLEMWWASLDVFAGDAAKAWDKAVVAERFGRAFTQRCHRSCSGNHLDISPACTLTLRREFYVIAGSQNDGIGREKEGLVWRLFPSLDDAYAKRKSARSPSIWRLDRHFKRVSQSLIRAFGPTLLEQLSPGFCVLLRAGEQAPVSKIMRDLAAWSLYNEIPFGDFAHAHYASYQNLIAHFDLPIESIFYLFGERKRSNLQLIYSARLDYERWEMKARVFPISTAHELLELQLRLRDALRPILTPAEIEEILAPPNRP